MQLMTKELANKFSGKYVQWNNGLRVKVLGVNPKYPDEFLVESINGSKQWSATVANCKGITSSKGWEIISEEEATAIHAVIQSDIPQMSFCCCGTWRVGMKNVYLDFNLKNGKIPTDETERIEMDLDEFFRLHGIAIKSSYTQEGVSLQFFSLTHEA